MIKLLLDQGLPRSAASELSRRGFDAVHTGDVDMARATDEQILGYALQEQRTVVTLDADFHSMLALTNAPSPSVVRIRIEGLQGRQLAALVDRIITMCEDEIEAGALITVDHRSARIRRLPLVR